MPPAPNGSGADWFDKDSPVPYFSRFTPEDLNDSVATGRSSHPVETGHFAVVTSKWLSVLCFSVTLMWRRVNWLGAPGCVHWQAIAGGASWWRCTWALGFELLPMWPSTAVSATRGFFWTFRKQHNIFARFPSPPLLLLLLLDLKSFKDIWRLIIFWTF